MPDLESFAGATLRWVRTKYFPAAFSLLWNGTEVGSVAWESLFSSRALLRAGEGVWRIRRISIWSYGVTDATSDAIVATLDVHPFGSAELHFASGRTLLLRRASILPPVWAFRNEGGSDAVTIHGRFGALFRGGDCTIEPAGAGEPEVGLVALIGIYTLVRRAKRRARR